MSGNILPWPWRAWRNDSWRDCHASSGQGCRSGRRPIYGCTIGTFLDSVPPGIVRRFCVICSYSWTFPRSTNASQTLPSTTVNSQSCTATLNVCVFLFLPSYSLPLSLSPPSLSLSLSLSLFLLIVCGSTPDIAVFRYDESPHSARLFRSPSIETIGTNNEWHN